MSQRTEQAYVGAFQQMIRLCPQLAPLKIYTDFELAAINAFRHIFNGVKKKCCYFHHTQAVWRRVQQNGKYVFAFSFV